MSIGLAYWIVYGVSLLFGLWTGWPRKEGEARNYTSLGNSLVLYVLLGFLGWAAFGAALHR